MVRFVFGVGFLLAWFSHAALAASPQPDPISDARLQSISARYFEDSLQLNPLMASFTTGEPRFEDKLAISIAPVHKAKEEKLQRRVLREIAALPEHALSQSDQLTLAILRRQVQISLDGLAFPSELQPVDQYGGVPVTLAELATGQSVQQFKTVKNYENFLKRLSRIPQWNAQAIVNMRAGVRQGIVLPTPLIERALETLQPLLQTDLLKHPYFQPVLNFPAEFTPAQRVRMTQAYRTAIQTSIRPSMQQLAGFMDREYLPKGRVTAGIDALPDGQRWYVYLVGMHTTTGMTPAEIHSLGLVEVKRIRAEMEAIKAHFGYKGELTEFLRTHATSPVNLPFTTDQQVLDAYASVNEVVKKRLPALFSHAPKAPLEIRVVPEISKATADDHYEAPAVDGSRPGIFFTVIMDPKTTSTTGMTTLFLHEGQPGHHFHVAAQQEMNLPQFRKFDWITAYGEGWALYAETLGHEMGLYEDKNALLGHLSSQLFRAVRLVTDTGLHSLGWTREQSMRYMMDVEGISEMEARRATERYMADPAQSLAYHIGALKIRALRDRAQAAMGARFTYAGFHAQVLGDGSLPLDLLEAKVDRWIAGGLGQR